MANGIRTGDSRGFNKRRSSKFREGSRVRQTPEEGWRTYRPKRCGNNNKDEDNSPKILNDKKRDCFTHKRGDEDNHSSTKDIPKVNVIPRLEFEFTFTLRLCFPAL